MRGGFVAYLPLLAYRVSGRHWQKGWRSGRWCGGDWRSQVPRRRVQLLDAAQCRRRGRCSLRPRIAAALRRGSSSPRPEPPPPPACLARRGLAPREQLAASLRHGRTSPWHDAPPLTAARSGTGPAGRAPPWPGSTSSPS